VEYPARLPDSSLHQAFRAAEDFLHILLGLEDRREIVGGGWGLDALSCYHQMLKLVGKRLTGIVSGIADENGAVI
jgi:hypothetical protein